MQQMVAAIDAIRWVEVEVALMHEKTLINHEGELTFGISSRRLLPPLKDVRASGTLGAMYTLSASVDRRQTHTYTQTNPAHNRGFRGHG
jgi:hypothetical protein